MWALLRPIPKTVVCYAFASVNATHFGKHDPPVMFSVNNLELESLILAQIERWR